MSQIDDLFSQLPIGDIAKQVGASESDTRDAIAAALPALFKGLEANASDPAGAASLLGALQDKDPSLAAGAIDISEVDTQDGAAIVGNIFGENKDDVAAKLGSVGGDGIGKQLMDKLLPILAPIVLSFIASKVFGSGSSGGSTPSSGGGIGDILGQVLGGATSGGSSSSGGGIGDILGQVLGGGGSSSGGGDVLGDLLGGLLGGGKR